MSTLAFLKKKIPFEDVRSEIGAIVDLVSGTVKPVAIYLFGSASRDDFSDQSDIDLLIVTHSTSDIRENRQACHCEDSSIFQISGGYHLDVS